MSAQRGFGFGELARAEWKRGSFRAARLARCGLFWMANADGAGWHPVAAATVSQDEATAAVRRVYGEGIAVLLVPGSAVE